MIVEFDIEAGVEYDEAVEWYRKRSPKSALKFVLTIGKALENIAADTNRFPRVEAGCQRCGLQPFPYSIIFHQLPDKVLVIAVAHAKRRPGYWRNRASW